MNHTTLDHRIAYLRRLDSFNVYYVVIRFFIEKEGISCPINIKLASLKKSYMQNNVYTYKILVFYSAQKRNNIENILL